MSSGGVDGAMNSKESTKFPLVCAHSYNIPLKVINCCRNATSIQVLYISGFGKLISFKYKTNLSPSLGLNTLPLLVLNRLCTM